MTHDTADETSALNAATPVAAEYSAATLNESETGIGADNPGGGRRANSER